MSGYVALAVMALLAGGALLGLALALRRKKHAAASALACTGLGNETVAAPPPSQAIHLDAHPAPPRDFDAIAFLQSAKLKFIRFHLACDRGDLDELRALSSRELLQTIEVEGPSCPGDIATLQAHLLELTVEQGTQRASVRFSGLMHRQPGSAPSAFQEVWNLARPTGSAGWLLAGIQQLH